MQKEWKMRSRGVVQLDAILLYLFPEQKKLHHINFTHCTKDRMAQCNNITNENRLEKGRRHRASPLLHCRIQDVCRHDMIFK